MTKPMEQMEARRLREELGMPIKVIAAELDVSPGSVHLWTADIELTDEQHVRNLRLAGELRGRTWRALNRRRRSVYQAEGRAKARLGDPLHEAGCMLYWAEGSKARNSVLIANSDLEMVRFFWRFLQTCFGLAPDDVSVRLNVYTGNGLTLRQIEDHWLTALELPRACLRKHTINHFPTRAAAGRRTSCRTGCARCA